MAWRSLRQRSLASALTALSVALGVALLVAVLTLEAAARDSYAGTARGVEALVGGTKGSRIDLVLSALFHVGRAPGRVPMALWERLAADDRIDYAIPVAIGDTYRGTAIVGTTPDFLAHLLRMEGGLGGEEAVAGADSGVSAGQSFVPSHTGLEDDPTHEHEPFTVRAVAPRTGTSHDRAIYVGLHEFLHLRGHAGLAQGGDAVTAVLLKTKSGSPLVLEPLLKEINDGDEAQAVRPVQVIAELFDLIGAAQRVLGWVAWLVIAVAATGVAVSLYLSMNDRRREVALLRALGATRARILATVLAEAALLCGLGALLGLLLGHGGAALLAPLIEARGGIRIDGLALTPPEPPLILALVALGLLAGLLPAMAAYRIDVARGLDPLA